MEKVKQMRDFTGGNLEIAQPQRKGKFAQKNIGPPMEQKETGGVF